MEFEPFDIFCYDSIMKDVKEQYKNYLDSEDGAKKYNYFKEILYGKEDSLILKLFTIIYPKLKSEKNLSILDIGGGDGKRLIHLMQLFQNKNINVNADLVEPSRTFTKNCRKEVEMKKYPICVKRNVFEKFNTKNKYDLIILIHSIYTFKNNEYLKKIKKLLKKDGLAVFVVNDENSFLAGLKKITDAQYNSNRNEIDSLLKGLKGEKHAVKKFDTKFSGILDKNELNKKGKLIFEWISMRSLADVSTDIKQEATNFFVQRGKSGLIKEREVVISTKF